MIMQFCNTSYYNMLICCVHTKRRKKRKRKGIIDTEDIEDIDTKEETANVKGANEMTATMLYYDVGGNT